MTFISNYAKTNTVLVIVFLIFWTYTEFIEEADREEFIQKVNEFMEETTAHHAKEHPEEVQ